MHLQIRTPGPVIPHCKACLCPISSEFPWTNNKAFTVSVSLFRVDYTEECLKKKNTKQVGRLSLALRCHLEGKALKKEKTATD